MISRFNKIEGVGKFLSSKNLGGLTFSEFNLIYGGNTKGKSTLTAILKSLQQGNKAIITGRKSFGATSQNVTLHFENDGEISLASNKWNEGNNDILIFDEEFINGNIHLGGEIIHDNQKKLNKIIIGEEGQKISNEIDKLQSQINKITQDKKTHGNIFTNRFPGSPTPITLQKFNKLKPVANIDEEILKIKSQIEDVKNQDFIKTKCSQIEDIISKIPLNESKNILSEKFELNKEAVVQHINKNWNNKDESYNFLQEGYGLLKENPSDCVFCGQELNANALNLIEEYSKLFSEKFIDFQKKASFEIKKFRDWNIELTINQVKTIGGMVKISLTVPEETIKLKEECDKEFESKLLDLSYDINFDSYELLHSIFTKIKDDFESQKTSKLKEIKTDLNSLQDTLAELEYTKIRYSENWDEYFEKRKELDVNFKKLQTERESKREELEQYSKEIFEKNHASINAVLKNLQADFRLDEFLPLRKIVGKAERIFSLIFFNDHKITLEAEDSSIPNFKNSLSESDKRVLAFAFFISLLKNNSNLDKKIIVLDDPFSSFDHERRRATINEIQNLESIDSINNTNIFPNQIIILTHEMEFYKWCLVKFPECTALEIKSDGIVNGIKRSTLDRIDKEKYLESESRKDLKEIIYCINSGEEISNLDGLFSKCRRILEDVFTKKYYSYLIEDIQKRKSIRTFSSTLQVKEINGFNEPSKFNRISNLCDDLNIELHENTLKNEGENGINVLSDFLTCLEII